MATILLSAAGAAIGSGVGGTVLGLSGAVVGRAVGATIGRSIDQHILGAGSDAVEVGKVERFHLSGVGYGTPIQEVWGRMRVAGQIIWASRFLENRRTTGGGKGSPRPTTETFSYSVSLAIALCRGEALRVGRVWADGVEIAKTGLNLRFYSGSEDQLPDPKIEAVEGDAFAPSYRGICYVVIENLALAKFGNRVPQFSFEVVRRAQGAKAEEHFDLARSIRGVSLIPGTGEYSLATTPVHFNLGPGKNVSTNVHSVQGVTDFSTSLDQLSEELPNCTSVSLVVSWFGSDLRCGNCEVQPKVEQRTRDGVQMPWVVSGTIRADAAIVPYVEGRPIYGGTPADKSVIEAIREIRDQGKEVMFYPFILMDQVEGNGLVDPWTGAADQPHLPWRGRITLASAPGNAGSTNLTSAAATEVEEFLGSAQPEDFSPQGNTVAYSGSVDWGYRRFILHYAHLCALAGGVDAFCIGSELRGLTEIRSAPTSFPMVDALRDLAAEVKNILGSGTKVSYAADWSEYFGLQKDGDVLFNLDPLWSDSNIDFVGIDNYMPISDWRDEPGHADSNWKSIYDLDYLMGNIAGGEGYDWYYDSVEGEAFQNRRPIVDEGYGEDWVFRYKDLKNWWSNDHHNRLNGVRDVAATAWEPGMKPIRFTEYGCAALDKATNQPNKFLDLRSSESALPRASSGKRDDYIQLQYYHAMARFWEDDNNNPVSEAYGGKMLDFGHSHAWAWDARPFPEFPGNAATWSDGANYYRGHWLNGRSAGQPLAAVVSEICESVELGSRIKVDGLNGAVRGFTSDLMASSRAKLQSLALAYSFDAGEQVGEICFEMRGARKVQVVDISELVEVAGTEAGLELNRMSDSETVDRTRLTYVAAESDFEIRSAEAIGLDGVAANASETEVALQLTEVEASSIVDRWLAEVELSRDTARFSLPKKYAGLVVADAISISGIDFRIDRLEDTEGIGVFAVRIAQTAYQGGSERGEPSLRLGPVPATPIYAAFMDLPLLSGSEVPHAPHVALAGDPWPQTVGVWVSPVDSGYSLNCQTSVPAVIGLTETEILSHPPGLWDRGSVLRVQFTSAALSSADELDVLNGANVAAIGDGSPENWEIVQFSSANLVGPGLYEVSTLLRGLAGSDAIAPPSWPVGSIFVLLDGLLPQVNLSLSERGLTRFYRAGALDLGFTDQNVVVQALAFNGIGLRPYSVSHLTYVTASSGDVSVEWVRRTRVDGDTWQSIEVPVGEEQERYNVRVFNGANMVREVQVVQPSWLYTASMQTSDGVSGSFNLSVSQISTSFGLGPEKFLLVE